MYKSGYGLCAVDEQMQWLDWIDECAKSYVGLFVWSKVVLHGMCNSIYLLSIVRSALWWWYKFRFRFPMKFWLRIIINFVRNKDHKFKPSEHVANQIISLPKKSIPDKIVPGTERAGSCFPQGIFFINLFFSSCLFVGRFC